MDTVTPWPALVRRIRFIARLRQSDLAQLLGVDQATVSRWERGTYVPDLPMQKRMRDLLHRLEPAIPAGAIEAMPGIALLYYTQTEGLLSAVSEIVAQEHGFSAAEMRDMQIAPMWPDSVREMHEVLEATDAWRSGDVALVRAKIFRINNEWCDTTGLPINGAGLMLWSATIAITPPDLDVSHCDMTIIPMDDLILD